MLKRLQQFTCPCCKGYIGETVPIDFLKDGDFTPQQQIIMDLMAKHVGAWVTNRQMEHLIWDNLGGKTHNPSNKSLNVQLTRLRQKVKQYGWLLKSDKRGKHKLTPMEANNAHHGV